MNLKTFECIFVNDLTPWLSINGGPTMIEICEQEPKMLKGANIKTHFRRIGYIRALLKIGLGYNKIKQFSNHFHLRSLEICDQSIINVNYKREMLEKSQDV